MKKSFWNKKIPTILGLILITIGIGVTSYFIKQGVFYIIKAAPTDNPQDVRITNVTDSSFTVSYSTKGKVLGSLNCGESEILDKKVLDDKDQQSGNLTPRIIHNITVRNLKPLTKYYFSITSGNETYLNNEIPYEILTGPSIKAEPPEQEPLSGKILLPSGDAPSEAIVYATIKDAQIISTYVKNDGTYILPLNSLRTADLKSYLTLKEDMSIKLLVIGDNYSSNIIVLRKQINPVPLVTLSKNYDFTTSFDEESTESAKFEKFPSFPAISTIKTTEEPAIISPQNDQEFSDNQPRFNGKALPNESIKIVINSDNKIETEIKADAYGNWSFRPSEPLSPGEHTISIITRDAQGILRTITHSFTVYASGSKFTDTVSPTPTIAITPTPTTVTVTTTTQPTATITPVITIAPIPTSTPASTTTPTPTTEPIIISSPTPTIAAITPIPTPASPGSESVINMGIIGIITAFVGIILLLVSRGSISFV